MPDYGLKRPDDIAAFFNVANWGKAVERFERAV